MSLFVSLRTGGDLLLEVVFGILSSSSMAMCDCMLTTLNGPILRGESPEYGSFADRFAAAGYNGD